MVANDGGEKEFVEKLIRLKRVSKVVKGGRRMSFSALMVVGDGRGQVGVGFGKANDVAEAVRKSVRQASKNLIRVSLKNNTIPHEIVGNYKSASVMLKPATPGTGIIAGGAVRAVMEALGVKDVLTKSLGSQNKVNIVKGVIKGLEGLLSFSDVARARGKSVSEIFGQSRIDKKIESE